MRGEQNLQSATESEPLLPAGSHQLALFALALVLLLRILFLQGAHYATSYKILSGSARLAIIALLVYFVCALLVWVNARRPLWTADEILKPQLIRRAVNYSLLIASVATILIAVLIPLMYVWQILTSLTTDGWSQAAVDYRVLLPVLVLAYLGLRLLALPPVAAAGVEVIRVTGPILAGLVAQLRRVVRAVADLPPRTKIKAVSVLVVLVVAVVVIDIMMQPPPPQARLVVNEYPVNIERDYDQRLDVSVTNETTEPKEILLRVRAEEHPDLILGFIGEGSSFEADEGVVMEMYQSRNFRLMVYAQDAQQSEYELGVELLEFRDGNPVKVDDAVVKVNVLSDVVSLNYEIMAEDAPSLSKTMRIRNDGPTIPDFTLVPDEDLSGHVRLSPEVSHARLERGATLSVNVEPLLHIGFTEISGKLVGTGGGGDAALTVPLAFEAPAGKRLFLAVAQSGSETHQHSWYCTNRPHVHEQITTPAGANGGGGTGDSGQQQGAGSGQGDGQNEGRPQSIDIRFPFGPGGRRPVTAEERTETETEQSRRDALDREEVALRERLRQMEGDDTDDMFVTLIATSLRALGEVRERLGDAATLENDEERQLSRKLATVRDDAEYMAEELGRTSRLNNMVTAVGDGPEGGVNLRGTADWIGVDLETSNAMMPALYFGASDVHAVWHQPAPDGGKPSAIYRRVSRDGSLAARQHTLSDSGEPARWPHVVARSNGAIAAAWERGSDGSRVIAVRTSSDHGETWRDAVTLGRAHRDNTLPRLYWFDDRLHVLWVAQDEDTSRLRLALSTDAGATFGAAVTVADAVVETTIGKMAIASNGDYHLAYEGYVAEGIRLIHGVVPAAVARGERSFGESEQSVRALFDARQPDIRFDTNDRLHLAFVTSEGPASEVYVAHSEDYGQNWETPTQLTADQGYSVSPSVSVDGDRVAIVYHSDKAAPGRAVDHLYTTKRQLPDGEWSEAVRWPSLFPNVNWAFLKTQFSLPWSRNAYEKHDVSILLNGHEVANMNDVIPDGNFLFQIDPNLLNYGSGNRSNKVYFRTEHFNPGHYVVASDFALLTDLEFVEQFVFADSQAEADELLYTSQRLNHDRPDIGLFSELVDAMPDQFTDGEEIRLGINVANIGQATASEIVLDVYGGPSELTEQDIADRYLLGQKRLSEVGPMQVRTVEIPLQYWFGLERIIVRARTPETDHDLSNNIQSLTLTADSPLHGYDAGQGQYGTGVLRVAVYGQPGELMDDVTIKLYRAGHDTPIRETANNPIVWTLEPATTMCLLKSRRLRKSNNGFGASRSRRYGAGITTSTSSGQVSASTLSLRNSNARFRILTSSRPTKVSSCDCRAMFYTRPANRKSIRTPWTSCDRLVLCFANTRMPTFWSRGIPTMWVPLMAINACRSNARSRYAFGWSAMRASQPSAYPRWAGVIRGQSPAMNLKKGGNGIAA